MVKTFVRVRLLEPYARKCKKQLGVTTLVSEISFVVDRAKLLNFGHRSRRRVHLLLEKNESLSTTGPQDAVMKFNLNGFS